MQPGVVRITVDAAAIEAIPREVNVFCDTPSITITTPRQVLYHEAEANLIQAARLIEAELEDLAAAIGMEAEELARYVTPGDVAYVAGAIAIRELEGLHLVPEAVRLCAEYAYERARGYRD